MSFRNIKQKLMCVFKGHNFKLFIYKFRYKAGSVSGLRCSKCGEVKNGSVVYQSRQEYMELIGNPKG